VSVRDHKHKATHGARSGEAEDGGGGLEQQKLGLALQRRQAERARETLHKHIDKVSQSITLGANLFQLMARDDKEQQLEKKLHPSIASKVADKVIDKIAAKIKDGLVAVSGVAKEVAGKSEMVFGLIKSNLQSRVATEQELTVHQLADAITIALIERQAELAEQLHAAIDALPVEKLMGVAATLSPLQRARPSEDDPDSPERGNLRDGMVNWAMENLLGLPAGDAVAMEEVAIQAYAELKSEVIATLPVHERGEAIQDRLAHPDGDREKLERVEEKMGPKFKANVERDKTLRARVDLATR